METLYTEDFNNNQKNNPATLDSTSKSSDIAKDICEYSPTRRIIPLGFCMVFAILFSSLSFPKVWAWNAYPVNDAFERHEYVDSLDRRMPYRLLQPAHVKAGETYPLVIFLHGSGERGNDNEKQLTYGAGMFTNPVNADKYPSYVIFPQTKERSWVNLKGEQTFMPGSETLPMTSAEEVLMELVNDFIAHNPVDRSRVYLVGMSMGAIATYDLVCRYPETFAAAIPICGAVNPERLAGAKDVKFMIFHGENDEEVPLICGREAYKALNSAGAQVEYIEFAGVGHECWDDAFNYPNFMPWLFSQTKAGFIDNLAEDNRLGAK